MFTTPSFSSTDYAFAPESDMVNLTMLTKVCVLRITCTEIGEAVSGKFYMDIPGAFSVMYLEGMQ